MPTHDPTRILDPSPASPSRIATFGMWLFLASLSVLFISSMVGYLVIRIGSQNAPRGTLHLPAGLWLSTALILLSSFTFHQAIRAIRQEHQRSFRAYLLATVVLALAFVAVQTPSLIQLLNEHRILQQQRLHLYGLIFFLILLHALHVLGGIIVLIRIHFGAVRHQYDHEHHYPIRHAAMYWHFLDIIWLAMFTLLGLTA